MDWLRSYQILNKQPRAITSPEEDYDPQACYDSFKEHWHQALNIINRTKQLPNQDDVLGVVNHLEQMVTLLVFDMKKNCHILTPITKTSKCLHHVLNENILGTLFEWGSNAGKFTNAIRCEELKLYEVIITESRHILFVHDRFLDPLLKLLSSCQGELFSREIEKQLVDLLNHLCAVLMQNIGLTDLFFVRTENNYKFIIFSLLITFVHRDNAVGMKARDGLLLCMTLSKKNKKVATYIVERSNFAVLAATGLNGLYSVLPNSLNDINVPDWLRITPDDVNDIKGLSTFVTSLEFSNAVAQVAHPLIREQLQEFLYRGFLIPVLGPALLQTNVDEQIAATAYLELILRTLTYPGLLYALLLFLINMEYDGHKLLNILINRIKLNGQLCLVSLALFETMINLNCEDLMLELIFKHLQPCLHLMLSQRRMSFMLDPYCNSFEKFLNLSLNCCCAQNSDNVYINNNHASFFGKYSVYLYDAKNKIQTCQLACNSWNNLYTGCEEILDHLPIEDETLNSLTSLKESSGYESAKFDENDVEDNLPVWMKSSNNHQARRGNKQTQQQIKIDSSLNAAGTAGPFLTILLEKLKNFLSNSIYINLHLTGLLSRLAVYSQPLLRTYLLDDSLILQPNVPSLFQIIGSLKQTIDEYMKKRSDCDSLMKYARDFLIDRETRLVNARRNTLNDSKVSQTENKSSSPPSLSDSSQKSNEPKRRNLNLPSITSMFGRRPSQIAENLLPRASTSSTQSDIALTTSNQVTNNNSILIYPKFNEAQHLALCAIILNEWIKELAALAQEHTFSQLTIQLKNH